MWTRSETPVINLKDSKTIKLLPINTQVKITHSTEVAEQGLLVLADGKTAIEAIYLSDKPIQKPDEDIQVKNNKLLQKIVELLNWIVEKLKNIFK